jgi:hypothetical protein
VIAEDNEVLRVSEVESKEDYFPVRFKRLSTGDVRWYTASGVCGTNRYWPKIVEVCAPKKEVKLDLSKAKVGDRLRLRNGQIVVVRENDGTSLPVCADGFWYQIDGVTRASERDAVELIKAPDVIERVDLTKVKVGDKVRTRGGRVAEVTELDPPDTRACVFVGAPIELWYGTTGVANIDSLNSENRNDIVEILPKEDRTIRRPDFTDIKVGDRVRNRTGKVLEVVEVNKTDDRSWFYARGLDGIINRYFGRNGVCNIKPLDRENDDDIIERLPSPAPEIGNLYKDLLVAVLERSAPTDLINLEPQSLRDLVKNAHQGVEPSKVSTAFVALLEGFSQSNQTIKIPVHYLKFLITL